MIFKSVEQHMLGMFKNKIKSKKKSLYICTTQQWGFRLHKNFRDALEMLADQQVKNDPVNHYYAG